MGGGHARSTSTRCAATLMSGYYREQKDEEEEQEQLEDVGEHVSMPGSISRGRVMNRYGNLRKIFASGFSWHVFPTAQVTSTKIEHKTTLCSDFAYLAL